MTIRPDYYKDARGKDIFSKMERGDYPIACSIGFLMINFEKYLWRAGRKTKDPMEDLEKAETYAEEWFRLMKMYQSGQINDGGEKNLRSFISTESLMERKNHMFQRVNRARHGDLVAGSIRGRLNWGHDDAKHF